MSRIVLVITVLLFTLSGYCQDIKPVTKGVVTLITNQKIKFRNLKSSDGTVSFTNISTNSEFTYLLNVILQIEDESGNIVHTRPTDGYKTIIPEDYKEEVKPSVVVNDTLFRPNYPAGVYRTKEDFIKKKPEPLRVIPKGIYGFKKPILNSIEHNCYFYSSENFKIRNVFAISYQGHLYFQVKAILSNRNKTDRAQDAEFHNSFVRVITGGENYYYTETDLVNIWDQAFAYTAGGTTAGYNVSKAFIYRKGIVWDFKNKEFNIFKNCKDYNNFISAVYPEGVQDCQRRQPDVWKIRKDMEKIK